MIKYKNWILFILILSFVSSCASVEIRAVRKGDIEEIRKYLADGGDPDAVDNDGNALIHIAVQYGQKESLDTLLQAGADANIKNRGGNTAAIMAAQSNRRDMIDLLIKYGGDMRTRGSGGVSTLMLAASKGNLPLMDILLKLGVPLDGTDDRGQTALFYSVSAPGPEALVFLLDSGTDPGIIDRDNGTALHLLSKNSQSVLASILLERGTDIALARYSTGETALHIASGAGAWKLVEIYLSNGASFLINQPSTSLGAPLFYALNERLRAADRTATVELLLASGADANSPSVRNVLPIVQAVEKLDVQIIELLLRWGASPNVTLAEKKSLLHVAVERKSPEIAALLLDFNADPDIRDLSGKTPLFYAVERRDVRMGEVLLSNGSNPNIGSSNGTNMLYILLKEDTNRSDGFSELTALMFRYGASIRPSKDPLYPLLLQAAASGNSRAVRYLLDSDANPNATKPDGLTALMVTSDGNNPVLSELLIRFGAAVNALDQRGNSALHYAAGLGSVSGVELLLRYGADSDPVNYDNIRPIELAPDNAQGQRIIELLLAAGAAPLPVEVVIESGSSDDASTVDEETVPVEPQPEETEEIVIVDDETDEEAGTVEIPAAVDTEDNLVSDGWDKARVLVSGEGEPRNMSRDRIVFDGFSASVPSAFPRNMYSKFNNQDVKLHIRNETAETAEVYIVNSDGLTGAVSRISPGSVLELGTWQGNTYPVYSSGSVYFGAIQTTGQQDQFYRLIEG